MEIQKLMTEISAWSDQQFSALTGTRKVLAKLSHLREEVLELQQVVDNQDKNGMINEITDCFMLLLGAAHDLNISEQDIIGLSRAKLDVNKPKKLETPATSNLPHFIKEFKL